MNVCAVHAARISTGPCRRCAKPVCELCSKWVEGALYCTPCGVDTVRAQAFRAADRLRTSKSPPRAEGVRVGKVLVYAALLVGVAEAPRRGFFAAARAQGARAVAAAGEVAQASDPRIGMASGELLAIRQILELHYVSNQSYPADFARYLRENLRADRAARDVARDPWSRPYRFTPRGGRFVVASDGPDKTTGTADDLEVSGGG